MGPAEQALKHGAVGAAALPSRRFFGAAAHIRQKSQTTPSLPDARHQIANSLLDRLR